MSAIGKDNLRSLRRYFFSLTSNEQDTYLTTKMQMVKDIWSGIKISFEYYLFTSQQCCRVAFKIALCVSNMRLHRVQWVLNGDLSIDGGDVPSMKGASEINAIGWMKNYFKLNCEVMPTSGRLHLSYNYTWREVYDAYRLDMLKSSDKYITYNQFTILWSTWFNNVVIPWGIVLFVQTSRAQLKVPKQQRRRTSIKAYYRTIEKHKHWRGKKWCTTERSHWRSRNITCI